jgi:hypothetical protein
MMDESILGWTPKTSKKGGHPHIIHEPHKPMSFGSMIRNAVEYTASIFVHHDIVDSFTAQ